MHDTFKLRPDAQKPFQKVLDPVHCNKTVLKHVENGLSLSKTCKTAIETCSAVDPDPETETDWIRIQWCPCIRIHNPDPVPGKAKITHKNRKNS